MGGAYADGVKLRHVRFTGQPDKELPFIGLILSIIGKIPWRKRV